MAKKIRREPLRTCAATRAKRPRKELLRVALLPGKKEAAFDPEAKLPGRGAYLTPDPAVIDRARAKGVLQRALRAPVSESVYAELRAAAAKAQSE